MTRRARPLLLWLLLFATHCACAKKQYGLKMNALQSREVTPTNFFTLLLMRLVYGIAYLMGIGTRLNGVMGGAFVPPGMLDDDDDDDDYDYGGGMFDYEY